MTTFVNNDVAPGAVVFASDHNTQGALLAAVLNGGLDNGNINASAAIATSKLADDAGITPTKLDPTVLSSFVFDFVASGCVWSGDSYGSTRNASMTSGVVYIGGKRVTVNAVSARSFTASKDTYIDIDNTGTLTYTEVTNNAASPALAANSIRLGIVVTGASNIANAGSVNQGEETKVLPIVSSVPYAVTDSLGNLICPRDPRRRLLGHRQITSNFTTTSASTVQVTGLSVPVIIPTGRKVIISAYAGVLSSSGANTPVITIWDGTVGSGTQLQQYNGVTSGNGMNINALTTPSSTSKTYNLGAAIAGGNTLTLSASSTIIGWIKVELE